ncbi:S66 peptidase family protein [Urechidicola croceus]|uniref:LD-carboxypeptidase n=1 Tax=Urechidicola croceus TaxID=1850246 RepID=A0A1D8P9U5_9FLAO|nr:LD-carboxypeptidase [Urechidicola croceus]AOW21315.1 LD-carboxypeptidase [Urechidicola croceus]
MITPKFLQKGDTVAIVSTARKISAEEIYDAISLLISWELKVVVGTTIGLKENQFAGTDEQRSYDFQTMLDDTNIKAIWCARGGYGTVRIIDNLDFSNFIKNPKWIIGYSDVTVLHSHLHNLGVKTLHATMPINVPKNTKNSLNSLKNSLFGQKKTKKCNFSTKNKIEKSNGILVGGNLSMFYSLLGSTSSIDTRNKILFLEDLDEYLYHIDRMLMNLKRNGYFDQLAGLIVGGMTGMHDNSIPFGKNVEEIILDIVSEYDFPVCFGFPAGHIDDNTALILGSEVELDVNENGTVLIYKN